MRSSWAGNAWSEARLGWGVLVGCTLGVAVGAAALPFYTAGVFVKPLELAFGWSRSDLSLASMAWTLSVVVCAPWVGALIDRHGVRGPACLGLVSLTGTFVAYSRMQGQLWIYLLIQVLGAALGVASTPVAFTRAVNERFDHARGAALGLTLAGTGITAAFGPALVARVVQAWGWRMGYLALGATALCATPLVWLLLGVGRRASDPRPQSPAPAPSLAPARSLRETLADPIFRRLLAAFFILALGVSGYVLHMIPMMTDAGLDLATAAAIQGGLGVAVIAGRVSIGLLADHVFAPRLAAAALSLTAAGMIALATRGTALAAPAALSIGFALGAEVDLIGYLTARYFGMSAYGRTYGQLYSAFVLGTGLSPVLIASLQSHSGNYALALFVCAALVGVAVLLFATAPPFPVANPAYS